MSDILESEPVLVVETAPVVETVTVVDHAVCEDILQERVKEVKEAREVIAITMDEGFVELKAIQDLIAHVRYIGGEMGIRDSEEVNRIVTVMQAKAKRVLESMAVSLEK